MTLDRRATDPLTVTDDEPEVDALGRDAAAKAFGRALHRVRLLAGQTQRALAARVGADHTYLSKLENGRDIPSRQLVERIDREIGAGGSLIDIWQGTRCPHCGRRR